MRAFRFTFIVCVAMLAQASAEAAFSLSVTPRRGGNHIRFEASGPGTLLQNEEVTLEVTTDQNAQYQITETVYSPLTNEFGDTIPQGNFVMFSPSSTQGTLRVQNETPLAMGQKPIFISNAAGTGESFVLVFNVHVPDNQAGGVYHTQLTFTAELVNATGVAPAITTLDIRLEIRPTFQIKISDERGGRSLDLGRISKARPSAAGILRLEIVSNIGVPYRIVQQLTEPLLSQEGEVMSEEVFVLSGGESVSQAPSLMYASSDRGAGHLLEAEYRLEPSISQKAGVYSGQLTFSVQTNSPYASSKVYNVPVRIQIDQIFYMDVQMEDGGSTLRFGPFRGERFEPDERKAVLKVVSNLGKAYQINQLVSRRLTNERGETLDDERFTVSMLSTPTGRNLVGTGTDVKVGETPIFVSDEKGASEQITLTYQLGMAPDVRGGSYSTDIKYSSTTL